MSSESAGGEGNNKQEQVFTNRYTDRDEDFAKTSTASSHRLVMHQWVNDNAAASQHHAAQHNRHHSDRDHHRGGNVDRRDRRYDRHSGHHHQRHDNWHPSREHHHPHDHHHRPHDHHHHQHDHHQHQQHHRHQHDHHPHDRRHYHDSSYDRHRRHDSHDRYQDHRGDYRGNEHRHHHGHHDSRQQAYDHHQERHYQREREPRHSRHERHYERNIPRAHHERTEPSSREHSSNTNHDNIAATAPPAPPATAPPATVPPATPATATAATATPATAPPATAPPAVVVATSMEVTSTAHASSPVAASPAAQVTGSTGTTRNSDGDEPCAVKHDAVSEQASVERPSVEQHDGEQKTVEDGEAESCANAKDVAAFYNQLPQLGLANRQESPIIQLRSMNNWIKSVQIKKGVHQLPHGGGRHLRVLDLCCGKGGDLLKWRQSNVQHLAGVDIAETSIQQCSQRARQARLKFSTEFHAADCTRVNLATVLNDGAEGRFDVTSCQFAVHYGFESEAQAQCILDNACQALNKGGVFIGTVPNSNRLVCRLRQEEGYSFGNSVYRVSFDESLDKQNLPLFGCKYHFQLQGAVDVPEYLVYFPLLCRLLDERHDMELVWQKPFHDFVNEEKEDPRNRALMQRMKCLAVVKGRDVGLDHDDLVGSISEDEWEAIGLYTAFCFQKRQ
ncbi:mRNA cap guanine-N7 methyltransferase-like [Sycon ciliatum]|uniref:mRNA cap guanine-N7 methyltransferase-like n=1 Tax=Sycon ciliatum TaxID=27933 RepID=UPI0031F626FA